MEREPLTMNKPVVKRDGTIVDIQFPNTPNNIRIRAERIKEYNDNVRAEISVFADLPAVGRRDVRINRSRTSLLDDGAKNRLISSLEMADDDILSVTWADIVNTAFDYVIDAHREQSPVKHMTNLEIENIPRVPVIHPFFTKGVVNLIWSPGGTGKSMFSLYLAILASNGLSRIGISAMRSKVLYCDWEEEENTFRNRLLALQRGLGIEDPNYSSILWKRMTRSLPDDVDEISRICADEGVDMIFIDSVSPALGGSANDQECIERFIYALRSLGEGMSSICIDHTNKQGELFGSSYKYARARQVYELKQVGTYLTPTKKHVSQICLYHRKTNDTATRSAKGFEVMFHDADMEGDYSGTYTYQIDISAMSLGGSSEALAPMSIAQACIEILKSDGAMSLEKLTNRVGAGRDQPVSESAVDNILNNQPRHFGITSGGLITLVYNAEEE